MQGIAFRGLCDISPRHKFLSLGEVRERRSGSQPLRDCQHIQISGHGSSERSDLSQLSGAGWRVLQI
jgi:hypothetical protein